MSEVVTSLPLATLIIMAIAAGIAFLNSGINRVLINYFIGRQKRFRTGPFGASSFLLACFLSGNLSF